RAAGQVDRSGNYSSQAAGRKRPARVRQKKLMAIAPYVPFNTICVATPVVGQPMMIVAPANFAQLNAFDLLTENQPVDFVKWTTHVISSSQQEIRPTK